MTAFDAIMQVGKYAIAFIYAGWVGGFGAIKILWSSLPGVIGEAGVGAANLALQALEFMANKAIAAINWLVDRVNPLLDRVGLTTISRLESVALPRMENSFAGSTARMAGQIQSEFSAAFGDAMTMMDSFSAKWRENTIAAAKARLAAKAEEIRGDKADKTAKGPKTTEAEKALKAAQDFARNLELETAKIGKTPIEIKRMEVAMAALKAPTDEARIAILQAGEAWEKATKAQAEKEFIKNTVAPLELQIAMLGKSTKAQELANLEAEKEQIVFGAQLGEIGILRKKTVARVDSLSAAGFGGSDDLVGQQIAVGGFGTAQIDGDIGLGDEFQVAEYGSQMRKGLAHLFARLRIGHHGRDLKVGMQREQAQNLASHIAGAAKDDRRNSAHDVATAGNF